MLANDLIEGSIYWLDRPRIKWYSRTINKLIDTNRPVPIKGAFTGKTEYHKESETLLVEIIPKSLLHDTTGLPMFIPINSIIREG